MFIASQHPKQVLLFCLVEPVDQSHLDAMKDLLAGLTEARSWSISPPEFVDDIEATGESGADQPIHTFGGFVYLYSGWPPYGDQLPYEVDQLQYDECVFLFERLSDFTAETGTVLSVEFGGEEIGQIVRGEVEGELSLGFLNEWRRVLDQKRLSQQ